MKKIQKRNLEIVEFDERKIENAIFRAFLDKEFNGTYKDTARENTKEITEKVLARTNKENDIISVEKVQDIVEDVLMKSRFKDVAKSYIRYRNKQELSRGKFLDRQSNFIKTIEKITFEDSGESDLKRENANIDGNSAMGTMLQYGSNLSKEFAITHILKDEHSKAHNEGRIHVHDLDFMAIGTQTCCHLDLDKLFKAGFSTGHGSIREPQSIASYASLSAIAIQANQNEMHGGQSINLFDYYLAPGVLKSFNKNLKMAISSAFETISLMKNKNTDNVEEVVMEILNDINISSIILDDELILSIAKSLKEKVFDFLSLDEIKDTLVFSFNKAIKKTDKDTFQAMESLVHNLNTMNSRAGSQTPFSSLNFGTDISEEGRMVSKNLLLAMEKGLGRGETAIFPILIFKVKEGINYNKEDRNYDLFKLAMRVSAKRLFPNFAFIDAPFNLQYYKEGNPHTEISYMGCRTRVISNINGDDETSSRGNLSFTSINLPRLGTKHMLKENANIDEFFNDLDMEIALIKDQLLERFNYQSQKKVKNFPFLMGQGIWKDSEKLGWNDTIGEVLKHGTLSIGFIGLAECLKALTGEHHGESEEAQELGLKIIGFIRDKMDEYSEEYGLNFSLIATPAESTAGRFLKLDKKLYGEIEGITDREYYTNSFHVPVYHKVLAHKKITLEAPYHALTNAGHITYVELDGSPLKNLEAFEKIVRLMKESGIGYGSINHPVDRDPVCGYTGIIGDTCPSCGRKEEGVKFDRIRRITGYLTGTLDRFNSYKQAEVRDRVKHM